jgi:hypothetical protein
LQNICKRPFNKTKTKRKKQATSNVTTTTTTTTTTTDKSDHVDDAPNIVPVNVQHDEEETVVVNDIVDDGSFGGITNGNVKGISVLHRRGVVGCAGGTDLVLNDRTIQTTPYSHSAVRSIEPPSIVDVADDRVVVDEAGVA